jgi:ABC-type protease/lipase transport system fused ATPase/permease subunit
MIGARGVRLSGGQRQRIGLARAVFGDPRFIVLDEPNANLDQTGEAALTEAIEHLKEAGVALIIVGHRPSTLAVANKVVFLKEGRVEMFGERDQVLEALRARATESPPHVQDRQGQRSLSPKGPTERGVQPQPMAGAS